MEEIVYINPLTDFGFKRIFGTEENKDLLIDFLNACIGEEVGYIEDLTYLPTEQLGALPYEKDVVFDIYCTNRKNEHFIIEMQRGRQHHFSNRVITYVSRVVSNNVRRGDIRYNIPTIYSFNLLDFDADEFRRRERFFWKIQLKDDDNEIFSKKITLFFIELTKFANRKQGNEFQGDMQQWLYLLKNINRLKEKHISQDNPTFGRFYELCNYSKLNVMEKQEYEKSILDYEGVQDAVACAREDGERTGFEKGVEKGFEKGISQGREEGMEKGIEKGIAQGREEGREEGKKELVITLFSNGMDIATISKMTGLAQNIVEKMVQ